MRVFQRQISSRLLRSAAFVALAGLGAGCSGDMSRFQDGFFTGSVNRSNPPSVATTSSVPQKQMQADNDIVPVTPSARSIQRNELPPVSGAARKAAAPILDAEEAPMSGQAAVEPAAKPSRTQAAIAAPRAVDPVRTAETEPKAGKPAEGWTKAGGTHVTLGQGETIYNLSRRFGVPANAIMEANNIYDSSSVQVGQRLLIPTYVYSRSAPVSAPDNDPKTATAKSSRGTKIDVAQKQDKAPAPDDTPSRDVAVLPATPSTKERQAAADAEQAGANSAKKSAAEPRQPQVAEKPKVSGDSYVVASGDSLYAISKKTGVPVADLKKANGLNDGTIRIGQTLALTPGAKVAAAAPAKKQEAVDPVVTGDTNASAETPRKSAELPQYTPPKADDKVIEQAEQEVATAAPGATGVSKMRWPAKGRVIAGYGSRSGAGKNAGIDIAVPKGTAVKAAENGVVIYAGDGLKEFGKTVLVRHEDGLVSVYGHNGELAVERGQTVKRGQEIAKSGMTGNADTPKLHFEVRKNSKPVDPAGFLE